MTASPDTTEPGTVAQFAEAARDGGALRVWSVIITFFGDAALPRGGRAAASAISELCVAMGIEEGAVRTALSRLAKDGLLVREKEGRLAYYRLPEEQREEFEAAASIIYAAAAKSDVEDAFYREAMCITVLPPGQASAETARLVQISGGVLLTSGVVLGSVPGLLDRSRLRECGCLMLIGSLDGGEAEAVPQWALDAMVDTRFAPIARWGEHMGSSVPKSPLDCAALRTLLIHHWRRIVLKKAASAPHLQALTGEADARRAVERAYRHLSPKADSWFDEAIGPVRLLSAKDASGSFRRS